MSRSDRPVPAPARADPARHTAFAVLRALGRGRSWAAAWADADRRGALRARDRRFAQELVSGTLRLRNRLDSVLAPHLRRPAMAVQANVRDVLRLGAYQLLETDRVAEYSAVHATVELAKAVCPRASALVNAVLRSLQRRPGACAFPNFEVEPLRHLVSAGSHPEWLVRRWLQRFGAEATRQLCDYDNRRPALCLRVNRERASVAELLQAIAGSTPGRWSRDSVRCPESGFAPVRRLVQRGLASVQDESATLVVEEAGASYGERWLDLAAAPGGKACHLAVNVGAQGQVLAFDTRSAKVERIRANAARLGLPQLRAALGDARELRLPGADGVLLDAPCTGLGVLARRPDARWRKRAEDLGRLAGLQKTLLRAAAGLVRPGGILVYSVCSFEPEETLEVASEFTRAHPEFVPASGPAPAQLRCGPGILYFLPHCHGVDGGFVARWRRTA